MTRARAAATAICCLMLALCLAEPAAAEPGDAPAAPGASTGAQPQLLRLSVDSLTPKVITSASKQFTVSGNVTNVGDRKVTDIEVRLQLADAVKTEHQLNTAMAVPPLTAVHRSGFSKLADVLQPGQSTRIQLSVDLASGRAAGGSDTAAGELRIPKPGVYPLTVNVNGKPDYGGDARLAALNVLLPVRSLPTGNQYTPVRKNKNPFGMTVLWPIEASTPALLGTTKTGQPLLADDSIAGQLRQGGRLSALVNVGQDAVSGNDQLASSLCFAIDPELVQTAVEMRSGYQVRSGDGTVAGQGAQAARDWLNALASATKGHCVIPLPYADADLVALARAGSVDLEKQALDDSALRANLPGARLMDNVVWPADGMLDQRTMSDLSGLHANTALLAPANLNTPHIGTAQRIDGGDSTALTVDPLMATALRGAAKPNQNAAAGSIMTPADCPAVASQNGIATLIFRSQFDDQPTHPIIAAPPRRWNSTDEDLGAWVGTLRDLFSDHSAVPAPLASRVTGKGSMTALNYPPSASAAEIPPGVSNSVNNDNTKVRDLVGALQKDSAGGVEPLQVTADLQKDLLRAVSGAWRGNGSASATAAQDAEESLHRFTERISIGSSRLPVNLASKDSQLPVSVTNSLPLNANVRIYVSSAGLQTDQSYAELQIPAHNSRTMYIPVKVRRSGRFNVDIRLTTPGQITLGNPVRVDVTSSAFGAVTVAITGGAFALLILLSGRRIYRRVRAAKTQQAEST